MSDDYGPYFDHGDCICDHDPSEHDDGFGCMVPDCSCLAGWSLGWSE